MSVDTPPSVRELRIPRVMGDLQHATGLLHDKLTTLEVRFQGVTRPLATGPSGTSEDSPPTPEAPLVNTLSEIRRTVDEASQRVDNILAVLEV